MMTRMDLGLIATPSEPRQLVGYSAEEFRSLWLDVEVLRHTREGCKTLG